ncbi:hypothetical protein PAXINDRAFT_23878, partial [Paxillus involutus ATCC 200175]
CVTGLNLRHIREWFQQSSDTISCYFQKILVILLTQPLYSRYNSPTRESIFPKIRNNPKFWLFFKNTIRAIDGSHIHAAP